MLRNTQINAQQNVFTISKFHLRFICLNEWICAISLFFPVPFETYAQVYSLNSSRGRQYSGVQKKKDRHGHPGPPLFPVIWGKQALLSVIQGKWAIRPHLTLVIKLHLGELKKPAPLSMCCTHHWIKPIPKFSVNSANAFSFYGVFCEQHHLQSVP